MKKFTQTVIHGKKLGRTIGFPTANMKLKKDFIEEGTYKINIIYKGKIYSGIGTARNELGLFEAHIFDFEKEIYGEELEIIILEKIRENRNFDSLEALKKAIEHDKKIATANKNIVMSFGTFDIFHKGHKYFLQEAKKYGDELITIIARDENVKKLKGEFPKNNENIRKKEVETYNISDTVVLGDKANPMKWIKVYKPQVIALGYDQVGFSQELKEIFPEIEIVRIGSFKPKVYKSSKLKKIKNS